LTGPLAATPGVKGREGAVNGASVEIQGVRLRYGGEADGLLALDGIDLTMAEGEFVSVVGPSGCGKSTLLKALTGLWPITSGSARVDGDEVRGPLKIVGMAFQNATLLPWRDTLDNVLLPLEIVEPHCSRFRRHRAEYEDMARELLDTVGLAGFADKKIWELSGGMQQRVQLCRALIHEPRLLVLDEPFGALDAFTREDLWDVLQNLWMERRPTVVLVTHDLREAAYLADRVLVMSARPGRFIAERHMEMPRPRALALTFEHDFIDTVRELRNHIDVARATPVGLDEAAQ
jgi:NitT/TauT family transport system ATP-binding protein